MVKVVEWEHVPVPTPTNLKNSADSVRESSQIALIRNACNIDVKLSISSKHNMCSRRRCCVLRYFTKREANRSQQLWWYVRSGGRKLYRWERWGQSIRWGLSMLGSMRQESKENIGCPAFPLFPPNQRRFMTCWTDPGSDGGKNRYSLRWYSQSNKAPEEGVDQVHDIS
jgi:hypothetical protein